MRRKIQPNRYPNIIVLTTVGLYDEVSLLLQKVGWENFMTRAYPAYPRPTCKFLSSFHLDERARFINFRLGNRDFKLELFKLNDVFKLSKGHEAHIQFDKNEF